MYKYYSLSIIDKYKYWYVNKVSQLFLTIGFIETLEYFKIIYYASF